MGNLSLRVASTIFLWTATLGVILARWKTGVILLLAGLGLAAQSEFYAMFQPQGMAAFRKTGLLFGLLLMGGCWYSLVWNPSFGQRYPFWQEGVLVGLLFTLLVRVVLWPEGPAPIGRVAITLLGFVYVPYLLSFLARLALLSSPGYDSFAAALYLVATTKCGDAAAFLVGSAVGRHKLLPRVSPGKTWEGAVGGLALSVGVSVGLWRLLRTGLRGFSLPEIVGLGLFLGVAGVVGDLAKSVAKRQAQVKDSGSIIPGIGGALDLIDSVLFTSPLLYWYTRLRF
ncbi:phosphatidate cytidylyltransferase [Candidatus Methylacidithermus pantelleriae]|uniref:Phosphatidate cytidylyltransferase n=1 Tax=Candidatus Methylacidithermus pantelleriae TaxID=2744239 RepID=A0A8J2BM78_9BACT|nr:phosphatidate cytidylyltransferase [Candidatus Methylacidithermus pantelleriae]CAF0689325.1 Phosphatidate cytidylyltransferase [Candidatus Methylacidithermus pantelleriae]